ncbi:ureidoglycolate lyase [Maritimibacter alkaliphilus]|uniref:ureidoglycolate lyase n=1 Tax=Maritimibacter alkaliphilus TaxID=404236 RepID=UPI001C9584DC|nr:ureidoglycolate lyase [Maritimibacter alkaliphilus]MBY6092470.1 ureidoglycolate lyase [Maritimibacter alkaliphilus]
MPARITAEPLSAAAFAPYGDVLEVTESYDKLINAGMCERYNDRAQLDFGPGGRAGLSIFRAQPRSLPYTLDLLERHPEGSQAFVSMSQAPWMVIVAPDVDGRPGVPQAFLCAPGQAVNFHRGTWHGVLTPLAEPGLFAVIDRIGDTANLEEVTLDPPILIVS